MNREKALAVLRNALACYSDDCIGGDKKAQAEMGRAWKVLTTTKPPAKVYHLTVYDPNSGGQDEGLFSSFRKAEARIWKLQEKLGSKIHRDDYDITTWKVK